MLEWTREILSEVILYLSESQWDEFEIRSWPYDESGEGRFQLCVNGMHRGNFKTLTEAKNFAEYGVL